MATEAVLDREVVCTDAGKRRPEFWVGTLLLFSSIVLSVGYPFASTKLMPVLSYYLSRDQHVTPEGMRQFVNAFYCLMVMQFGLGLVLLKFRDQVWISRVKRALLADPMCATGVRPSPRFVLMASSLVGLFMIAHIRMYDPGSQAFRILYKEDGVFESLTPSLMVAAAVLLGRAILISRRRRKLNLGVFVTGVYVGLALLFVVYAGEEVSWGQRLFGWETPEAFSGNVQQETNIHNYFNSHFHSVYRLPVLLPFAILLSVWLEYRKRWVKLARPVLPHASAIGLACLIAFVSLVWYTEEELIEEMLALFALVYAARVHGYVAGLYRTQKQVDSRPV